MSHVTKLTRSQVEGWRREAAEVVEDAPPYYVPCCAVLDSAKDVLDLCDALLEAWSDYMCASGRRVKAISLPSGHTLTVGRDPLGFRVAIDAPGEAYGLVVWLHRPELNALAEEVLVALESPEGP